MAKLLKVFLPYTLLAGIGLAIWVSNCGPVETAVSVPADAQGEGRCHGCDAKIRISDAIACQYSGKVAYYCCEGCRANSERLRQANEDAGGPNEQIGSLTPLRRAAGVTVAIDPVCHMEVSSAWGYSAVHRGHHYYFCTAACRDRFVRTPAEYLGERCPVCRQPLVPDAAETATYLGKTYRFCSVEHRRQFQADPAAHFLHTMWGIPTWLYYASIALVLVASFGLFELADRARSPHTNTLSSVSPDLTSDRIDLLRIRAVQFLLTSRPFRFVCQAIIAALFLLIIATGLIGNQNPALNIAPLLTWTIWWGGLVILIMFAGKAWCYVCPWDALAGWLEKLRLWRKTDEGLGLGLKWPRALRNIVLATVLFVGLTWIELGFGVTMKPQITAYLAMGMLLLTVGSAFLFERKGFCRYGCLVGRVSGLYAMFSGVEIRPRDTGVCRSCPGKECVRGSASAYGCPTFLFPGNLKTNTYCIQCTECLQACPHDNLAVNLRPWGADLVHPHQPRTDEAYLALLMLSITGFHGLTMTPNWSRLTEWMGGTLSIGPLLAFSLGMAGLMLAPILIYALLAHISFRLGASNGQAGSLDYHDYFVRYAYALLPIALFYHLAHNLEHLLMEGPKVVRLASDPFGWGWNLLGTLDWTTPPLVSLGTLWFLQVLLVLVGHVYSLWVAQRTSLQLFGNRPAALRSQLPMLAGMISFSVFSLWLLKQPMEMRTSAM